MRSHPSELHIGYYNIKALKYRVADDKIKHVPKGMEKHNFREWWINGKEI